MQNLLIFKSLHIIFVVTWFAGLFYMPRLMIYFSEANEKNETEKQILQKQFLIMEKRLWFGITIPSSVIVPIFGISMMMQWFLPLHDHPWLRLKFWIVVLLYVYQFYIHYLFYLQSRKNQIPSPLYLRILNEVSTLFLVSIVFLVVLKDIFNMLYGIVGLFILIFLLMSGIYLYKKWRKA